LLFFDNLVETPGWRLPGARNPDPAVPLILFLFIYAFQGPIVSNRSQSGSIYFLCYSKKKVNKEMPPLTENA